MRKRFLLLILWTVTSLSLNAHQALWGGTEIISPDIKTDNTVTFRFQAESVLQISN